MADDIAARKESRPWLSWLISMVGWACIGASIGVLAINFGVEFHVDPQTGELALTDGPRSQFFSSYAAWVSLFAVGFPLSLLVFPRTLVASTLLIVGAAVLWIAVSCAAAAPTTTTSDWLAIAYVALWLVGMGLMCGFAPGTPRTIRGWAPYFGGAAVAAMSFLATPYVGKLVLGERLDMDAVARTVLDLGQGIGFTILYAPLFIAIIAAFAIGAAALIVFALRVVKKMSGGGAARG